VREKEKLECENVLVTGGKKISRDPEVLVRRAGGELLRGRRRVVEKKD